MKQQITTMLNTIQQLNNDIYYAVVAINNNSDNITKNDIVYYSIYLSGLKNRCSNQLNYIAGCLNDGLKINFDMVAEIVNDITADLIYVKNKISQHETTTQHN